MGDKCFAGHSSLEQKIKLPRLSGTSNIGFVPHKGWRFYISVVLALHTAYMCENLGYLKMFGYHGLIHIPWVDSHPMG